MKSERCKATLITGSCDRAPMDDRGVCGVCEERIHHAMIGRLYRSGNFEFARELDQLYNRKEG